MENALLIGLSRQMALGRELDIVANNIANMDTTGFKADNASFSQFLGGSAGDAGAGGGDRQIRFVEDRTSWTDFSQGALQRTGDPLDVAIDGKGFFVVQTTRGQRYTRNGAFSINASGQLVTLDGSAVLGTSGPITFQPTDRNVSISGTGLITVREGAGTQEASRGQLQIVDFSKPQQLRSDGGSTFAAPPSITAAAPPPATHLVQGAVEKSNVNAVSQMARMIEITQSYSDVAAILQQQSDQRRNALQQLSQVPTSSS
jgi:flagellar basal-body rod protein FlgF